MVITILLSNIEYVSTKLEHTVCESTMDGTMTDTIFLCSTRYCGARSGLPQLKFLHTSIVKRSTGLLSQMFSGYILFICVLICILPQYTASSHAGHTKHLAIYSSLKCNGDWVVQFGQNPCHI